MNRRAFIKTSAGIFIPAVVGLGAVPSHRRIVATSPPGSASVTPESFPNLEGWWKADSFALADGTAIGDGGNDWIDQTGNGHDGQQTEATNRRPLFKTNIFGSMPAIRFDGSNDYLQLAITLNFPIATEYTVIVVSKCNATPVAMTFFQDLGTQQFFRGNNNVAFYNTGGAPFNTSSAFSTAVTDVVSASIRRSSAGTYGTMTFRENKTARGTGAGANFEWQLRRIADRDENWFNGDMAELLAYSSFLSDSDMDNLYDNYLKPRWGLP